VRRISRSRSGSDRFGRFYIQQREHSCPYSAALLAPGQAACLGEGQRHDAVETGPRRQPRKLTEPTRSSITGEFFWFLIGVILSDLYHFFQTTPGGEPSERYFGCRGPQAGLPVWPGFERKRPAQISRRWPPDRVLDAVEGGPARTTLLFRSSVSFLPGTASGRRMPQSV